MGDRYSEAKEASREQMMRQADGDKQLFIRKMRNGLGDVLIKEIDKNKRPMYLKRFWRRFIKVLGG